MLNTGGLGTAEVQRDRLRAGHAAQRCKLVVVIQLMQQLIVIGPFRMHIDRHAGLHHQQMVVGPPAFIAVRDTQPGDGSRNLKLTSDKAHHALGGDLADAVGREHRPMIITEGVTLEARTVPGIGIDRRRGAVHKGRHPAAGHHQAPNPLGVSGQVVTEIAALDHGIIEGVVKVSRHLRQLATAQVRFDRNRSQSADQFLIFCTVKSGQRKNLIASRQMFDHWQPNLTTGTGYQYPAVDDVIEFAHGLRSPWKLRITDQLIDYARFRLDYQ